MVYVVSHARSDPTRSVLRCGISARHHARPGHLLRRCAHARWWSCGRRGLQLWHRVGRLVHVLAGSLGVSAIVLASAELFTALKLIGAAYLVWLGLRTFLSARRDASTSLNGGSAAPPIGPRRAFREGVLVEALNPKTAAFFLAFIPQFVDPTEGHVALQFVVLGFVSVALNTLADIVVAFAASGIREGAAARPALIRRLREASGAAMIALGIGLALAKRPAN